MSKLEGQIDDAGVAMSTSTVNIPSRQDYASGAFSQVDGPQEYRSGQGRQGDYS